MTGFATEGPAVRAFRRHLLIELTAMRILVARGAGEIGEMIGNRRIGVLALRVMTIGAGNGQVGIEQRKAGLFVASERKG